MVREFAWKPLSVTIMSVNCSARSTFDISSVPAMIFPLPAEPGRADVRLAGVVGDHVRVLSVLLEAAGIGEAGKADLSDDPVGAVGVDAR